MKAKGYSLWLMPEGETREKFTNLIKKLAEENSTFAFEPHVTLLGEAMQSEEDIIKKMEELTSGQKQFPLNLTTIDYQDFYFRALFVKVEITEPLMSLRSRIKEIFGMQDIPPYMPHLSLLYGDFSPSVKEKIIENIGKDQTTQFAVNSIHLFKTSGEINAWRRIREFHFS